ncbi:MAG: AbrB/MazE/SpoVT family DNA-binding domain-containing protein [Nanoarchaeota archaeon]|nr:AbrB/MazE/SpoVT family DNA-binding domain-containing protein [Nanoarchaeota archaeon]
MERKLVKQGQSTLMISLPKTWIDNNSLNSGDPLNLNTFSDRVIISKKRILKKKTSKSFLIKNADYNEIREILEKSVREDIQKIELQFKDPSSIYFIQLILKSINGYEMFEESETHCLIEKVSNPIEIDVDKTLNKIINITKCEFIIIKSYLEKGQKNRLEELRDMRDGAWKYRNMTYSFLKEKLLFNSFDEYFRVHIFEYNCSFAYWLYRSFNNSKIKKVSPEFLKLYSEVVDYFAKSVTKMKKNSPDYINYIMEARNYLLNRCEEYISSGREDAFLVIYLGMLIQNIHNPKSLIV